MFTAQFLFTPTARAYLAEALTQDQQLWLSNEIMKRPLGIMEFMLSSSGMGAVSNLIADYEKFSTKPKALPAPTPALAGQSSFRK